MQARIEPLRIVAIGGGTGLPVLLAGLDQAGADLTAIVNVSDDGGSSGRLRQSFDMPAVGDLRNCLVAMSGGNSHLADIFQHRFSGGGDLEGHAVGNLILSALYQKTGSLMQAIEIASLLLPARGRALAATEIPATLCAALDDGTVLRGESNITAGGRRIERVWLEPDNLPASPGVLEAIHSADAIVLAPGSLYTSLLPNLLVAGVADAIRSSSAAKVLVCNLMTQPGETDGFSASDHLRVVGDCLGRRTVEFCVVNSAPPQPDYRDFLAKGTEPVACDLALIRSLGAIPVEGDLLLWKGRQIRHNPVPLGQLVVEIVRIRASQNIQIEQFPSAQEVVSECLTTSVAN
jgi:uncharacterized cofD-like protein